ncbi:hypothetical protein TNCV_5009821 [Trichonephila clavipes]|nr:hypothetical protein TNCV_5009821 [Trichonephila clavipes]
MQQRAVYPGPVVVQACTTHFRFMRDRENMQAKETIQIDGKRRVFEHCVPRVVANYQGGIWLMASAECMGGRRDPTPQSCSTGC